MRKRVHSSCNRCDRCSVIGSEGQRLSGDFCDQSFKVSSSSRIVFSGFASVPPFSSVQRARQSHDPRKTKPVSMSATTRRCVSQPLAERRGKYSTTSTLLNVSVSRYFCISNNYLINSPNTCCGNVMYVQHKKCSHF